MKKIQRQSASVRIRPPRMGPATPPMENVIALSPESLAVFIGRENFSDECHTIDNHHRRTAALYQTENNHYVALPEKPHRAEPMVKTTKPKLYMRTRPNMSATPAESQQEPVLTNI